MNITWIIIKSDLLKTKYNKSNIAEYTKTHISLFVNTVSNNAIVIL